MKQKLRLPLVTCLAYCSDEELNKAIDYPREQVRVLGEHQEGQGNRIRLTNKQRMRVAAEAKRLSRKMPEQCTEMFTPDTIMWWYRQLVAKKYNGSQNRSSPRRPQITREIVDLVILFKRENPRWGYQKITDQIVYLGHKISKYNMKNLLIENGYDPEPDFTARSTWNEFIKSHWDIFSLPWSTLTMYFDDAVSIIIIIIMNACINPGEGPLSPSTALRILRRLPASNAWAAC